MKKLAVAALLLAAALGSAFAEDIMLGNGYFIGMDGLAGAIWDAEEPIPVLELIDVQDEDQSATLYYSIDYEYFMETVSYESYSDEYGSVVSMEFYSEDLGAVTLHMSSDAELEADELTAILASYMIDTDIGYLTYVGIVAMEDLQGDQEAKDAFNEYVNDLKEDYESEL